MKKTSTNNVKSVNPAKVQGVAEDETTDESVKILTEDSSDESDREDSSDKDDYTEQSGTNAEITGYDRSKKQRDDMIYQQKRKNNWGKDISKRKEQTKNRLDRETD